MFEIKKIVIFDDDKLLLETYQLIFSELPEVQLFLNSSAKRGIEVILANRPNLIILDIMMPEVNGLDFLQTLQKSHALKSIPVLLVSNLVRDFMDERTLPTNVFLLKKPFDQKELMQRVQAILAPGFNPLTAKDRNLPIRKAIKNRQILIFEDNEFLCDLYRDILTEFGFFVNIKPHCDGGLDTIRWNRPDLILLDINLPGMDGLTFFNKLRAEHAIGTIPVLFVSDLVVPGMEEGLLPGKTGFLPKPFTQSDLLRKIGHLLDIELKKD